MIDGALDLLIMVLILGVAISMSFGLTIPLLQESNQMIQDEIYDKTAERLEGEDDVYDGDMCMSYEELILTIMNQTYFMPKPRMIDVCGEVLAVKAEQPEEVVPDEILSYDVTDALEFVPRSRSIGEWVRKQLHDWHMASPLRNTPATELRFSIMYDLGNTEQKSDDMYAVFILYQKAGEDEPTLHRCLKDGGIR